MGTPIISEWLTHFVGRAAPTDDEANFQTLLTILGGQEIEDIRQEPPLSSHVHRLGRETRRGNVAWDPSCIRIDPLGSLCEETLFSWLPVCFCDIPEDSLRRHISIYGAFGVAFTKSFLIQQGANPVFYVAKGSLSSPAQDGFSLDAWLGLPLEEPKTENPRFPAQYRGAHLDSLVLALNECLMDGPDGSKQPWEDDEPRFKRHRLYSTLLTSIFTFVKCFDETRPESDPLNYYFEREWRVPRYVHFDLADIQRIYVRRRGQFKQRLLDVYPLLSVYELPGR